MRGTGHAREASEATAILEEMRTTIVTHGLLSVAVVSAALMSRVAAVAPADACSEGRVVARSSHSLAYDTKRQRVVMFGGVADGADAYPVGLWSWDGTRWTCDPSPGPSDRMDAFLAFDEARGRLVLFGGRRIGPNRSQQFLVDTWEYDGAAWSLRNSAGPGPRIHGAIAYDPTRRRVVMSGGGGEDAGLRDTWEWDGERWRDVSAPLPSQNMANALIASTDGVRLLGGAVDESPECAGLRRAKLFALRVGGWVDLASPGPCFSPQAPVASAPGGLLLYAGWDGPNTPAATWLWTDGMWRRAESAPPKRRGTAVAYDVARKRVVMFGGDGESGLLADTWEWDGTRWTQR